MTKHSVINRKFCLSQQMDLKNIASWYFILTWLGEEHSIYS